MDGVCLSLSKDATILGVKGQYIEICWLQETCYGEESHLDDVIETFFGQENKSLAASVEKFSSQETLSWHIVIAAIRCTIPLRHPLYQSIAETFLSMT